MYRVRRWVSKHPRFFELAYAGFERLFIWVSPLLSRIGYQRIDKPFAALERVIKGFLFDTRMCGSCTLSATGMVCPMNCPKSMRNGPCGGVRANGRCEVKPEMPCVWNDAYVGSQRMKHGDRIQEVQVPVDHRMHGTSSWMREIRRKTGAAEIGDVSK
ncbi:MAG: methylenetetrahydrofolate reductase C-terminal domain-containing protein [Woeseiaceae bacterium]